MPQRAFVGCWDSSTTQMQLCRAGEQSSCNSTNLSRSCKVANCQPELCTATGSGKQQDKASLCCLWHTAFTTTWKHPKSHRGGKYLFVLHLYSTSQPYYAQRNKRDEPTVVHPRSAHWKKEGLLHCWINHPNSLKDWDRMQIPMKKSRAKHSKEATALTSRRALSPSRRAGLQRDRRKL